MSLSCTVSELLSLVYQHLKTSRDPEHIPFGVIYHACTSTPVVSVSTHLKRLASSIPKIRLEPQNKKTGYVTPTTHVRV